ncbi:MAG: TetR/AcrR family transcriptional regulator [Pseudomonadota bacterium]
MATNEERREATRSNIISAARECFVSDGYENTRTETILDLAGVSRGAMYHHFSSKRDVFEAVYIALVEETIAHALRTGAAGDSPLEELLAACSAWLSFVRKPEVAKILLDQGPKVLGWKKARDIEAESSLAPMRSSLERAYKAGEIDVPSVAVAASLINALLAEAALISAYGKPRVSIAVLESSIRQFIDGLRVP